jgi:hypothetical protein
MGEVIRQDGMRVWVWSDDHLPPHVHVGTADWEVSILIGEFAVLAEIKGGHPGGKAIRAAIALVAEHLEAANAEWRRCHG